jgi:hypothetical protein
VTLRKWLLGVFVAFDECAGAWFPRALPGETISARAATARDHGHRWGCWLCRFLDWLEADHCDDAIANDRARAQAVLDDLERELRK